MPLQEAIRTLIYDNLRVLRDTDLPTKWNYAKTKISATGVTETSLSTEPDIKYILAARVQSSKPSQAFAETLEADANYKTAFPK